MDETYIKVQGILKDHFRAVETLQKDLDEWLNYFNNESPHQRKVCYGRTPVETLLGGKQVRVEKI
ncbi:hypothetical protein [Candidatus Nitrotoga sp. M5]|uniref:hypothetical protein n=1 Tax=Candidatus Nitrotoga sp. M5 TaxID=2890409 RepID=UPI001F875274|nr:hypothetical protein NTGM5_450002 [Candidatus Nitrotoga sp. M5]